MIFRWGVTFFAVAPARQWSYFFTLVPESSYQPVFFEWAVFGAGI